MLVALCAAAACASPHSAFDEAASRHGFDRSRVAGDGFEHVVYRKSGSPGLLHVYLASDGRPWLRPQLPAGDPTPRNTMMLDLMALDPAEAILLGRPCYHGLQSAAACQPALWTGRRYAPEVISSLATALSQAAGSRRSIVLIGHSGGGALAMLLAARLPEVRAVVTIAAPLDHAAWTEVHGYLPLNGSLNPVEQDPLPERIRQIHLVGAHDTLVPPPLLSVALARIGAPPPLVIAELDHNSGWLSLWPDVLACLRTQPALEAMAQANCEKVLLAP